MGVPEPISIHAPLAGCDFNLVTDCHSFFISIHTPLAGCDLRSAHQDSGTSYFNPRTPYGVRLTSGQTKAPEPTFQSTHPSRGATAGAELLAVPGLISIHAPLAGCDVFRAHNPESLRYFNPRTPRGVRPRFVDKAVSSSRFQSTHPLRGATLVTLVTCTPFGVFQSTHPLRGATSTVPIVANH